MCTVSFMMILKVIRGWLGWFASHIQLLYTIYDTMCVGIHRW